MGQGARTGHGPGRAGVAGADPRSCSRPGPSAARVAVRAALGIGLALGLLGGCSPGAPGPGSPGAVVSPAPAASLAAAPTPSGGSGPVTTSPATEPAGSAPELLATVPGSIDAACASDVSAALNAWIADQPDGSTLVFPQGSCYRLGGDTGIDLTGRDGLTLIGTGSRLELRTTGASNLSSSFFLQQSTGIAIRGFSVDGGNDATGTAGAAAVIDEAKNGVVVRADCADIEIDGVSLDRLFGFGILVSADGGSEWPAGVSIHDSTIRGGEMGVGVVAGRRIELRHNMIEDAVYSAVDLEPDPSQPRGGGFEDVVIADNDVTRYSWGGKDLTSWFVAANPADEVLGIAVMDRLTITGNRVHVGAAMPENGNFPGLGGLGIRADKANTKNDVVITGNTTDDDDTQGPGRFVMYLANVHNLTVTGNSQGLTGGAGLVSDAGTTGSRDISDNHTGP
jgi:hypothetical protein